MVEDLLVVVDDAGIGLEYIDLGWGWLTLLCKVKQTLRTTGRFRMVAYEPTKPSPIATLRRLTGGFGTERRCFVM